MWRALFMAVGIFMVILGAEFLIVEKVVMADSAKSSASQISATTTINGSLKNHDFKPPEGLPWILLSAGAVIIIYTFTIPKRVAVQTHPS